MSDIRTKQWLQLALRNEDFSDFTFTIHGTPGKDAGYMGNLAFITVTLTTKTDERKVIDLVMKTSSRSEPLLTQISASIKVFFQKEIHIYTRVKPAFENFQQEMGVNLLDFLPKCYGTKEEEDIRVVILENLKVKNYELWDRKMPMDFEHLKLILETFGKWHGFSIALKHKKPNIFKKLVENNVNAFPFHILYTGMDSIIFNYFEDVKRSERGLKEEEIQKFKLTKDEVKDIFVNWYDKDLDFSVITHGDCWTNNFMFKYQDDKKPLHAYILDWQCGGLASPIMDLSFFIYTCVDTEIYIEAEDLLRIYYQSFSKTLEELGCDSAKVFPFEKLQSHWKNFSLCGLLFGIFALKFALCDAEDAPNFAQNAEKGKTFLDNYYNFIVKDDEYYFKRATNNMLHYIRNLLN